MASPSDPAPESDVQIEGKSVTFDADEQEQTQETANVPETLITPSDNASSNHDEVAQLASLAAGVRDQDDLERDIGRQADKLLLEQADERDKKRLEKTQKDKDRLQGQIRQLEKKLTEFGNHVTKNKYRAEIEHYTAQVKTLDTDLEQIRKRMEERRKDDGQVGLEEEGAGAEEEKGNKRLPGESQREFLIRTGKITPFSKMGRQLLKTSSSLGDVLLDAEEEEEEAEDEEVVDEQARQAVPLSHRNLLAPGFDQDDSTATSVAEDVDTDADAEMARRLQEEEFANERPAKRRRLQTRRQVRAASEEASTPADESDAFVLEDDGDREADLGDSLDDGGSEGELPLPTEPGIKRRGKGKRQTSRAVDDLETQQEDLAGIDDSTLR